MYLSTLTFTVLFLPVMLLCYYCIPSRGKNALLLACSLLVYSWGVPMRLLFLMANLCFLYGMGLLLEKCRKKRMLCRILLGFSVLLQSVFFLTVRYFHDRTPDLLLPLGTAFMTLQGIGYLIGIYRKRYPAEIHFINFSLYIAFFPTIFAGPLMTYPDFAEQLKQKRSHILHFGEGISLYVRGLAEKVVLADTMGYIFRELRKMEGADLSMLGAWLTAFSFVFCLYFELHGYANMARGLGICFGIQLPHNFRYPFLSESITTFFQNWNVTVTSWFQNFCRPFWVNKSHPKWVQEVILVGIWGIMGIWYGFGKSFLVWGILIGILQMVERLGFLKYLKRNYVFGVLYTNILLLFLWVLFFTDSFAELGGYWKAMLGFGSGIGDQYSVYYFTSYIVPILLCVYIASSLYENIAERVNSWKIGKLLTACSPLLDSFLLIFCIASMLYAEAPNTLWLQ